MAGTDASALVPFAGEVCLAFVNGRPVKLPASLPAGVHVGLLTDEAPQHLAKYAVFDENSFVALNTALFGDVAYVHIAPDVVVEEPIHIAHVTVAGAEPTVTHPRVLVVVSAGARCTVVETYSGTGRYFTNGVTEVAVAEGASLDHYHIQIESRDAFHVSTLRPTLGAALLLDAFRLGRRRPGPKGRERQPGRRRVGGTEGLYLARGTQHVDHHLAVDHADPEATSRQLYKGILDEQASAVFNGRILVRADAQRTDATQTNKNLLLSDDAVVNAQPELLIFADDVRCTHGATIGQLDRDAMFYLQSRGIEQHAARDLLVHAFAYDIVEQVKVPTLRASLERMLFQERA